jgi:cytochrome c oxidase subunit 2
MMQQCVRIIIIFFLSLAFLIQGVTFTLAQTEVDTSKSKPSVAQGEKLYKKHCTQCHKLNQKLVGPALAGINERRPESWLIPWIKNSQKMVQSGDEYAVKIYNEYNQTIMPPMPLNNLEVKSVLAYIKKETQKSKEAKANKGAGKKTQPTNIYADGTILNDGVFKSLLFIALLLFVVLVIISLNIFGKVLNLNNRLPTLNWNKINAYAFSLFFIAGISAIIYELNIHTQYLLPEAASVHGQNVDQLFMITLIITGIMFLVTQTLLFLFAYRYGNNNTSKKALYYPANDKLEIFWTTIPAISLSIMVIMGFVSWQNINSKAKKDAQIIEVYGYRFNWKFRYPGKDGELGETDFTRTKPGQNPLALNPNDEASMDDIITSELHLPKNKQVKLKIRSRDVIHSVYLPHFRVQMYAQPGMNNTFKFTPTISSKEMQDKVRNNKFKYELACNQVCGAAHYNMKADVYVEKEAELQKWLSKKSTFRQKMKQFSDE